MEIKNIKGNIMSKNYFALVILSLLTLLTSSCSSVNKASFEEDLNAKKFTVDKGQSNIYLYRNQVDNFDVIISAEIDGKHVSNTEDRTYVLKTLKPGKHIITAHAENTSKIEVTTEADKNYYVWLEVTLGLEKPRTKLHLVSKGRGEAGIKGSKLVN